MQKQSGGSCRLSVAIIVSLLTASFLVDIGMRAYAQDVKRRAAEKKEETYTRPEPTRPIRPEIPKANRYQQDKIFLEYADSLYRVTVYGDTAERQILKGTVKFRQAGMWMYCDSAYYYPNQNSLDAFGNVKMEQGDTLFVYADKLYYEGNRRMARLKNGPSCRKVKLINRDVTLTTDSLDYDLSIEIGWYVRWGTIDDKVNTLTSLYGEYSPNTKNADFYHLVELVNNENGFTMLTDTLHYNTDTHLARIESKTEIRGENDTIITNDGIYDTQIGNAELLSRSMIIHRDSNNNVTTLEGDSIIFDKLAHISRAYMFRDPRKRSVPMVLTDTAHKTTLIGGYGIFNDSTREALATDYPLLMEYSQGDTLFLRADTITTFIVTEMIPATRRRWTPSGLPEKDGVPIIRNDFGHLWLDDIFFSLISPLSEVPLRLLNAATPDRKKEETPTSVKPEKLANENKFLGEGFPSPELKTKDNDSISPVDKNDSVSEKAVDTIPKIPRDFHVALAYHRARFFKQDLQGVADSMVFIERDSMLYMFHKPIIWSGERQVTGNRIDVHFNDSTADWALLPESGMMSEYVDEDFYNQLAGKKILARFANQTLNRLEVSGNVETIFLPQESDSTFNRLVQAESSFLTIDLSDNKMDRLKMWPEVSGTVTPIFLVKRAQKYLQKFHWWSSLRPVRESYGDKLHWADDLGEVSEELEQYFLAPSDFGELKSLDTGFKRPPTTLIVPDEMTALEEAPESVATALPGDDTLRQLEENETQMRKEAETVIDEAASVVKEYSGSMETGVDKGEVRKIEQKDSVRNAKTIKNPVKKENDKDKK